MVGVAIPTGRKERRTLLSTALQKRDIEMIAALAKVDPDLLNSGNSHGNNTALGIALSIDLEFAGKLIDLGANPHAANDGGWTLMDSAVYDGDELDFSNRKVSSTIFTTRQVLMMWRSSDG